MIDPPLADPPDPDPPAPPTADPDPPVETATETEVRDVGRRAFGLRYDDDEARGELPTARPRRAPYTWVTHISKLIAGDASCWWAGWFRAHYTYDKVPGDHFDLDTWKVDHTQMVQQRAAQLQADGWVVTVEDQNKFTLRGRVGTLGGKPDIVASKGALVVIEDCKSGQRRSADRIQVAEYMFALPLVDPTRCAGKRVSGRVVYRDGWVEVPAESFTPELRQQIVDAMNRVSGAPAPERTPSAADCRFCDISKADCPVRVDAPMDVVTTTEAF
jgi:hypothetical protein